MKAVSSFLVTLLVFWGLFRAADVGSFETNFIKPLGEYRDGIKGSIVVSCLIIKALRPSFRQCMIAHTVNYERRLFSIKIQHKAVFYNRFPRDLFPFGDTETVAILKEQNKLRALQSGSRKLLKRSQSVVLCWPNQIRLMFLCLMECLGKYFTAKSMKMLHEFRSWDSYFI